VCAGHQLLEMTGHGVPIAISPSNPNMASAQSHLKLVRPAAEGEQEAPTKTPSDRRAHRRLTASELSWLNRARIKYGPEVSLIDLSVGGAQIESTSYSLQPGSTVVIELTAGERSWPVPSQVLRCHVDSLTPSAATYRGAVLFKRPFDFREIAGAQDSTLDIDPAYEYARLNRALGRAGDSTALNVLSAIGTRELAAALRMIASSRGHESAAPFMREIGGLFRMLTTSVESETDSDTIVREIMSRLQRSVPSLNIRMIDAGHISSIGTDAVYFHVPNQGTNGADSLIIEFPQGCALEAWHLKLLEAGAHLIAFTWDFALARQRSMRACGDADTGNEPNVAASPGWHRLVVRYLDGRLLKGYGRDFHATRGSLDLWNEPNRSSESRVTIPFAHLKAVFFVHDFDGNPAHSVGIEDVSGPGRRITVTFVDGEVLRGLTLGYSQNAQGFFVSPLDSTTNNLKIFVLAGAVRHVQFQDSSNRTPAPQPVMSLAR
jgi:uncharacterized protein DUF6982